MIVCPHCRKELDPREDSFFCVECDRAYPVVDSVPVLTLSEEDNRDGFEESFFEEFHEKESNHFWHNGRKRILYNLIRDNYVEGDRLIELGCGSGNVVEYINRRGIPLEGGDIFMDAITFARRKSQARFFRIDLNALPFRDEYDAVGLFDVLEHIEDDRKVLENIRNALKSKGMLFITVPAGKNLWSYYDEFYCHKRRYEKQELKDLLEGAGFRVVTMSYYVFLLHPLVYLTRKLSPKYRSENTDIRKSDAVDISPFLNRILTAIMYLEAFIIMYVSLPWGSSLIAVAEKIPEQE